LSGGARGKRGAALLALAAALVYGGPACGADDERSRLISLASVAIDVTAPPDVPAALQAPAEGYYLVKYPGPVTAAERESLAAAVDRVYVYLPYDTFLVRSSRVPGGPGAREVPGARWVGPYHPAYKIAPAAAAVTASAAGSEAQDGRPRIVMLLVYPDADMKAVRQAVDAVAPGRTVGARASAFFSRVRLLLTDDEFVSAREALARIPEVFWLDIEGRKTLVNDTTIWVGQSGVSGGQTTPVFAHGIHGEGQVVGIIDTGIDADMCYFRDTALGLPPRNECNGGTVVNAAERKVLAVDFLWTNECAGGITNTEWDTQGHGTHVAGTVAGDNFATPIGHDPGDGMAPGARLVMQDAGYLVDNCGDLPGIGCPVVDLNPIFQQAYTQGARLHTNSYGDNENAPVQNNYTAASQDVDEFMWNHKDFQIFFAAGNSGPGTATVGSPSTAKNVISVGATAHGTSAETMAGFSSCGPTDDNRIKPDLTIPGASVISAGNDGNVGTNNCGEATMSGTSMASPAAAGFGALARQYYADGYYPSGTATPADAFPPTSALVKATLLNSAQNMTGVAQPIPSNCQGWGRILLDNALFFPGDARRLWVKDDTTGFPAGSSGETRTFSFTVASGSVPFKATVVWTDFPSTPAANPHINDDLDLEVAGPGGTFKGNVFSGGQSVTGGTADRRNTAEQVLLLTPTPGTYTVTVRSFTVPNGPQPFAVVVTGDIAACAPPPAPAGISATPQGPNTIRVDWTAVAGATAYNIYRSDGACPGGPPALRGTVAAPATTFLDGGASGGSTYSYHVAAVLTCESALSACAQAVATGPCLLPPAFAGVSAVSDNQTMVCGLTVSWNAAATSCVTNPAITYSVYRGPAGFTPSAANRIATCLSGTTLLDRSVGFNDYTYVVRAEDSGTSGGGPCNGGNVDGNTVTAHNVPTGGRVLIHSTDFESGANGWAHSAADSTCTTGNWGVGDPDGVVTSGVVTQPEDDHTPAPGVNALFTAPNLGGPGTDDVDNGVCTALSPVVNASAYARAQVVVFYTHGQRDTGGDPSDFFRIDVSTDGGASYPVNLASIGDVTTNAVWTEARGVVTGPGQLRIRVQASDGTAAGDIIEGAVDDVTVEGWRRCFSTSSFPP
jgi:hypothetical protein